MKKKKKHPSKTRVPIEDRFGASMYLRLCHRCLYLNEGSKHIDKCHKCESRFTEGPAFEKNFNPNADFQGEENPIQEALSDFASEQAGESGDLESEQEQQEDEDSEDEKRDYQGQPISGLSVLW